MDIKLVPYADKVTGNSTAAGKVSADDLNQIKKILNAIVTALFTLDNSGVATTAIVKLAALPNVDLLPLFNNAAVVGGKITISGTGGGGNPQLTAPASLTSGSISAGSIVLNWSAVTNAASYTVIRSLTADFANNTTIYNNTGLTVNDTGLTASTLYYYAVVAHAAGYADSARKTASFTTTASGGAVLQNLNDWSGLTNTNPAVTGSNSYQVGDFNAQQLSVSAGISALKIPSGGSAIVQMQCPHSTVVDSGGTAKVNTGWLSLHPATNSLFSGVQDSLLGALRNDSGVIGYNFKDSGGATFTSPLLATNGFIRLRTDGTLINLEYSDDGATWTLLTTRPQPAGDIYPHFQMFGSLAYQEQGVTNVQYSGLV